MDTSPNESGARQFSLRKLLLWIAVCAVYLSVLRSTGMGSIPAIGVTIWLAVILIARLWWGMPGGMIAVSVAAIVWGCVVPLMGGAADMVTFGYFFAATVAFGIPAGLVAFGFVIAAVRLVDWLDSLGRRR